MFGHLHEFCRTLTPMRWVLVGLFGLLVISEFSDGVFDIGNVIAPILFILLINQYYLFYKNGEKELRASPPPVFQAQTGRFKKCVAFVHFIFKSIKAEVLAESPRLTAQQRATKILMNNLFIFMFLMAIVGGLFHGVNQEFKLFALFVWSLAFLGFNVREFLRTLSYARLFMANLGLIFVLGSISLIIV